MDAEERRVEEKRISKEEGTKRDRLAQRRLLWTDLLRLGIPGLIGVVLVCTVCCLYFKTGQAAEPLTNAMSLIIGFYFGVGVQKFKGSARDESAS
jgi:hypothetical protein